MVSEIGPLRPRGWLNGPPPTVRLAVVAVFLALLVAALAPWARGGEPGEIMLLRAVADGLLAIGLLRRWPAIRAGLTARTLVAGAVDVGLLLIAAAGRDAYAALPPAVDMALYAVAGWAALRWEGPSRASGQGFLDLRT